MRNGKALKLHLGLNFHTKKKECQLARTVVPISHFNSITLGVVDLNVVWPEIRVIKTKKGVRVDIKS